MYAIILKCSQFDTCLEWTNFRQVVYLYKLSLGVCVCVC